MARPKEFDTTAVLEKALDVFWDKGYEAASLQDLLDAMRISRSSFYETYGSKHDLFLAAMERYVDTRVGELVGGLEGGGSGKEAIRRTMAEVVDHLACPDGRRGCFVNNCAVELAPHDAAAAVHVQGALRRFEDAFYRAVRRGQKQGEIRKEKDPRALARFLANNLHGLQVLAKTRPGRQALEDVVEIALQALD